MVVSSIGYISNTKADKRSWNVPNCQQWYGLYLGYYVNSYIFLE